MPQTVSSSRSTSDTTFEGQSAMNARSSGFLTSTMSWRRIGPLHGSFPRYSAMTTTGGSSSPRRSPERNSASSFSLFPARFSASCISLHTSHRPPAESRFLSGMSSATSDWFSRHISTQSVFPRRRTIPSLTISFMRPIHPPRRRRPTGTTVSGFLSIKLRASTENPARRNSVLNASANSSSRLISAFAAMSFLPMNPPTVNSIIHIYRITNESLDKNRL